MKKEVLKGATMAEIMIQDEAERLHAATEEYVYCMVRYGKTGLARGFKTKGHYFGGEQYDNRRGKA